jgi:predicted transcriptional regulator
MSIAFSIFIALLYVAFFVGLLLYASKMPKNPTDPQASDDLCFGTAESLKALAILSAEGAKPPATLASLMGISVQKAEAILTHLAKSDLVRPDTEQEIVPLNFEVTPTGRQAFTQFGLKTAEA